MMAGAAEGSDPNRLLTPEEAASFMAVGLDTLAKWRETGRVDLPFVKLGRKAVRYRYGDVVSFIERRVAANTIAARALG